MLPSRRPAYAKPVQGESSGKAGKRGFTRLDIAEPPPGLCKAGASESNESLLLNCRVQPGLCKGTNKKTISRDVYTNEWTHKPDKLYNIDCPLPYVRNPI